MKRFTFFLCMLLLSSYLIAQSSGNIIATTPVTIVSDKADYLPGEIANIFGKGFQPFETVTLQVLHADGTPQTGSDHEPWATAVAANGEFTTTWHVCEDDCLGSILRITAQGISSGLSATANFSDATSFVFVGSFKVGDGPCWNSPTPPTYTAREAAALLFGGSPNDYAISVNSNTADETTITHTAHVDGYGNTTYLNSPVSEDFKQGTIYTYPSFSAYVKDHSDGSNDLARITCRYTGYPIYVNYVWRKVTQTITTSLASLSFCANQNVSVNYTVTGAFNIANTFTAQLSDASGSFSSPIIIGSINTTSSGTINGLIPIDAIPGNAYRIRVVSSDPVVTGSDNGSNITIKAQPSITCPDNITVDVEPGQCGATVSFSAEGVGTIIYSTASGSFFPVGSTIITTTATTDCGSTSCSFIVTVIDNQPPSIICPAPVTINTSPELCSGTTTLIPPTVTDNCNSFGNALSFGGGYVNVPNAAILNPFDEWTIETWVKRTNTGVQESLIEKYIEPGNTYGYLLRILSNNKASAGFVFGSFGGYFITGTTTILPNTWYHLAATFNRATGEMKLYVNGVLDAQVTGMTGLPVIPNTASLKLGARGDDANSRLSNGGLMDEIRIWNVERTEAQIQLSMNSELGAQAGLVALYHLNQGIAGGNNTGLTTATDESGNANGSLVSFALTGTTSNWVNGKGFGPTVTNDAPATYPKGNTNVTWVATDASGNSATCTQVVTVVDNQSPVITCPVSGNTNRNTNAGVCTYTGVLTEFNATATDNCTITSLTYELTGVTIGTGTTLAGVVFNKGVTIVIWTASDDVTANATCSFTVTVNDNEKPSFTCPVNQNINLSATCQLVVPDLVGELGGNDNCGAVTFTQSPIAGASLASSHNQTHNVLITASDGDGNTQTCTVALTGKDVTQPTFTCPSNQNANLAATCQLIVPNLIAGLTGNDNCGTVTFTQSPVAGASLPSSHDQTHNIIITANDGNGNTAQCTVVLTGKDITPPFINCVENITKANDLGICGAVVNYTSPTNSDNCGCVAPASISGYTFLGTYNGHKYFRSNAFATWTNAKNISNGLGGHLASVNSSGEQLFLQGATTDLAWIGFTDEANEGTFVWVTGEPVTYTNWLLPSEPNNYGGNENYAVFNGHGTYWNDLAGNNSLQYIVEFECETNTGGVIVTQTGGLPSGSTFPVGITTNTFMATDAAGNTSTCSFTVTINDIEKPTVTKGTISSCYSSVAEAEAAALEATSYSDNCSSFEELDVNVSTEGTCSAVITVTVTDAANNSKSVSYDTKIDNISPVLSLTPASVTVNCQSVPPVPTVTANDNCDGGVNVTFTPTSTQGSDPAQSNYYNYTITRKWYATDGCGNTVEHVQTITVQDVTNPVITCPADKVSVPFDFGQLYTTIAIGTATASDNCADGNITITGTRSDNVAISNQQYPLGQTTVEWTATDPSGNPDGCTQTITVRKRNTAVTYTGDMTDNKICVQYSDIIYLQAKLTDNEGLVTPNNISGCTITFQLLSGTTVLRSKTATTNASGVAMDTFKIEQAPGMYTVKSIFAGDSYFNGSNDQDNCEVKQEDAIVEYNGSQYFTTASSTTLTGSITLAASLNDIDDGSDKRGDIRKAKATFRDGGPAGTVLGSANLPVGLVNPGILTHGLSATTQNNITLNSNEASSGGKIYQVWVGASDHYTGADAGPTPVTLALPGQDFVTGGGHLVVTNSAGTYAGTPNSKMNFGFTMKWNKSGKNLQGNINIVFRKWQLYNGVWQWRVYQAKSNAINSMAVVEVGANGQPVSGTNPAAFRKAIINTKANLKDVTDPLGNIDLGGNHNLTLDAWDHITTNGGVSDKISVTLMGATTNELLFSSSWSSNATQAQTITGGNINVRNSSGSGAAIRNETTKNAQMESSAVEVKDEFVVKAYPNPSQHQFALVITSKLNEAVQIKVYDALGRKIQTLSAKANETIQFGEKLKAGIYIAEVIQGNKRETVKLIKQ